jgi:hypothetical protein
MTQKTGGSHIGRDSNASPTNTGSGTQFNNISLNKHDNLETIIFSGQNLLSAINFIDSHIEYF